MNYRHIYHAGNFADVIKHALLVLALQHLQQKEKGYFALDAHGGLGLYDLQSVETQKTKEYEAGIGKIIDLPALAFFAEIVKLYGYPQTYPGSPAFINHLLRPQDRAVFNELHKDDFETLKSNFPKIHIENKDAYEVIRALVPPPERRGLVLLDPPFEKTDEFETMRKQLKEWYKRWASGTYMIWYPIKAHLETHLFNEAAKESGFEKIWVTEFLYRPRHTPDGLNGCGILFLNTPYSVPERWAQITPALAAALGGTMGSAWLRE
ncbi:MAG: 23S rRNA (adenine(2030)-N(6))-methyltransferase RlmJ [Alphaproteobacteria bacterium]|nr:23S rRNA (adenine(2030)-N(6))-methyltransferase RlmJ [Alphaproteobacteria bacterium]